MRKSTSTKKQPKSSAKKNDKGKPSITLIPAEAILGIARGLDYGAIKYGRYNFRLGISHSRLLDAALRHILAILKGEDIDKESGNPHNFHAMASLAMYEWMRVNRPDLNDLYKYETKNNIRNSKSLRKKQRAPRRRSRNTRRRAKR